jgi:type IV pilus assembly protein PilY1
MGDIKFKIQCVLLSLIVFLFFSFKNKPSLSQTMSDYCYVPPSTPAQEVKPNVLLVVDFSGSMQFPTYVPCTFTGYTTQKVALCGTNNASYNSTQTYWGYFDPDKCYKPTQQGFVETSCSCSRNIRNMTSSCISGNLLNWVTTTRIDAARKVLTGGKAPQQQAQSPRLISEGAQYTITDNEAECQFEITANQPDSRKLQITSIRGKTCNISINETPIVVFPSNPSGIKGIIHEICDTSDLNGEINNKCKAIMEFMIFASDDREGEILVGKNATIANLISQINNAQPYWGTPTGEALWEAYDYYKQSNDHNYEANQAYINRGNPEKDPYYDIIGNKEVSVWCRKGFVLLISDGAWNGDVDPVIPARVMAISDLRPDLEGIQSVITYVIYAWGDLDNTARLEGQRAMMTTAIFGGFEDYDKNKWPYPFTGYDENAQGSCYYGTDWTRASYIRTSYNTIYCNSRGVSYPLPTCNLTGRWDDLCAEWDTVSNSPKDGVPYNYYEADDIESLRAAILNALYDILRRASSQAAVACLTSRSGLSSIVVQPYYFPKFQSQKGERSWLGFLKGLWIDAKLQLREDTIWNKILDLLENAFDRIIQFITGSQGTRVAVLQGSEPVDNSSCSLFQLKDINELIPVFDAGCMLADINPNSRWIFFNSGNGTQNLTISDDNVVNLLASTWNLTQQETICIIRYLRGENLSDDVQCNYDSVKRPRELLRKEVCLSGDNVITWRLGDIISSTPSLVSEQPVNIYHLKYGDDSYREFINSQAYKTRPTVVFVSSNDGMLHAFRVGYLKPGTSAESPVQLVNAPGESGSNLVGKEEWAFIPRNALPYLKWYGNSNYCHIPTVDYRTLVVDAKINGNWKTLLIGAMGFGGKEIGEFSSSVFVLDITDPLKPQLLWERSLDDKTLTLSMPAVVKVKDKWYVALGSGPKEPEGKTFVSAKIYFFDLGAGNKVKEIPLNITAAVGDLMPVDVDGDYNDDAIYFGVYTQSGGDFYRLRLRNGDSYEEISSLSSGDISKAVSVSRPIFAASAFAKGPYDSLWVYFGTGRFLSQDDKLMNYSNYLVGFKDGAWETRYSGNLPTYSLTSFNNTTNHIVNSTVLGYQNVCLCNESGCSLQSVVKEASPITLQVSVSQGWYFELPKEVIISQPAVLGKTVEAVSYKPSDDICSYLGESNLISLYYLTGTANPRPVVLSPLATQSLGGGKVKVNPKISLGPGSPPLGNPFQVLGGPTGREYAKLVQISGTLLKIEQQIAEPLQGRIIHWVER